MGGHGSGDHGERRHTLYVDDCEVLRIWELRRDGFVQADGFQMGGYRLASGRTVYLEVHCSEDRGWLLVEGQRIGLSTSAGSTGGLRWWMHCPITEKRVACLYRHPRVGRFTGRRASRLRYRSSYQDEERVAIQQAQKALRRLAGPRYSGPPTRDVEAIPRPKRQRVRTYERNQERARRALSRVDRNLRDWFEGFVARSLYGQVRGL